jgi:hypothetical protein
LAHPDHPVVLMLSDGLHMLIAVLAFIAQTISTGTVRDAAVRTLVLGPKSGVVSYQPTARAVNNWRREAASHLGLPLLSAMALMGGYTPPAVSRCVKLNNYWCIKKAGWTGEIASDADGHVAFVSAHDGAVVAALLLRRYYIDLGRHSARAIIARWAPAECGASASLTSSGLATHGLGRTLRARWLAGHRRGLMSKRRLARSVIPDRPMPTLRAPAIMVGGGEPALASTMLAALISPAAPAAVGRTMVTPTCPSQAARLSNYAEHAIEGVVASPDADLKLFDADGHPTGYLAKVMENMASVEIGPLKVDPNLVADAIARARELTETGSNSDVQSWPSGETP